MCGILCICNTTSDQRASIVKLRRLLRHRGMDESGIAEIITKRGTTNFLCHERLSIVNPESGSQPLTNEDGTITVCVNGEIYNHKELRETLKGNHTFKTESDCEIILHLYEEIGADLVYKLNGDFAFVLYDSKKDIILVARDQSGVVPLYFGRDEMTKSLWFSSEMKVLSEGVCGSYYNFFPGHYYLETSTNMYWKSFLPSWSNNNTIPTNQCSTLMIREGLTKAVKYRLMADVPFGVCLSGGLDSSLVASIVKRLLPADFKLATFCIGLEGSPDLVAAKKVAEFLGTNHHEFHFTVQEGIDALRDVIYHVETYDVTTIRASTPMYLMARKIRSRGYKMVLSGEGADEIFGGYLYFHKAPNATEFHEETVRKINSLHMYDCLRANKSMMAWGVEPRVPFLDKEFLELAMNINPEYKMIKERVEGDKKIEKYILRSAFDTSFDTSFGERYLPDDILWRQKEQFSDGVGYAWIDGLKEYTNIQVTDSDLENASLFFPHNTPMTKEAYFYRYIFEELFIEGSNTVPGGPSIACSTAKAVEWDLGFKGNLDPSGRSVLGVHTESVS